MNNEWIPAGELPVPTNEFLWVVLDDGRGDRMVVRALYDRYGESFGGIKGRWNGEQMAYEPSGYREDVTEGGRYRVTHWQKYTTPPLPEISVHHERTE